MRWTLVRNEWRWVRATGQSVTNSLMFVWCRIRTRDSDWDTVELKKRLFYLCVCITLLFLLLLLIIITELNFYLSFICQLSSLRCAAHFVFGDKTKHSHLSQSDSSLIIKLTVFLTRSVLVSHTLVSAKPSTLRTSWSRSKHGTSTCWHWRQQTHPFSNTTSTTCRI